MIECGIAKQIAEHADEPQEQECPTCFCILDESLVCKPCEYEADARADNFTENQFNNREG